MFRTFVYISFCKHFCTYIFFINKTISLPALSILELVLVLSFMFSTQVLCNIGLQTLLA